jgi:hypothetical protein
MKLFQASGEKGFVCFGLQIGSTAGGIGDPAVRKRGVPVEKVLRLPGKVPYLIASDDQSIEGVGCVGQLRLCFAKRSEGKGVATKVVESGVKFVSMDNAPESVGKLGPTVEVVAQARAQSCSWGLVVDDLDIVAHFLKGLSEGKALK